MVLCKINSSIYSTSKIIGGAGTRSEKKKKKKKEGLCGSLVSSLTLCRNPNPRILQSGVCVRLCGGLEVNKFSGWVHVCVCHWGTRSNCRPSAGEWSARSQWVERNRFLAFEHCLSSCWKLDEETDSYWYTEYEANCTAGDNRSQGKQLATGIKNLHGCARTWNNASFHPLNLMDDG